MAIIPFFRSDSAGEQDSDQPMVRMSTADSQRAVRLHRIAESKEMVANRSESFRQRMDELAASAPSSGQSPQHHPLLGSLDGTETVVNMEARRIVVRDTVLDNFIRVGVLRSGFCFDEVVLNWHIEKNVDQDGVGCFLSTNGQVRFAPGSWEAGIQLEFDRSKEWAPLRECVIILELGENTPSRCCLGHIHRTRIVIVSDDVWPTPQHVKLPEQASDQERKISDWHKKWLMINDCSAWQLIRFFCFERMSALWVRCRWSMLAVMARAACDVGFSYLMVFFIDLVLIRAEKEGGRRAGGGEEAPAGGEAEGAGEGAGDTWVAPDWWLAVGLCVAGSALKAVHAQCTWWAHDYRGVKRTREDLRKWIAAQMVWVDNEQLKLMQTSSAYMSASIQGTEACVQCWVACFAWGESIFHYLLTAALVGVLVPFALPAFLLLPAVALFMLQRRNKTSQRLLAARELDERFLICSLSDFIENIGVLRASDAACTGRAMYNSAVMKSSRSHTDALATLWSGALTAQGLAQIDHHTWSDSLVQHCSSILLTVLLLAATFLVSARMASPGQLVIVISAFASGTEDLIKLSQAMLQMIWASAGMREISQILSMPNDVHELANQTELEALPGFAEARRQRFQILRALQAWSQDGEGGGKEGQAWTPKHRKRKKGGRIRLHLRDMVSTLGLLSTGKQITMERGARVGLWRPEVDGGVCEDAAETAHFLSLHGSHDCEQEFLSVDVYLGGITQLRGLNDEEADNLLRMLSGLLPLRSAGGKLQPTLPFFRYLFVPHIPQLVEGSIMLNLLLGVSDRQCPSDRDAWLLARLCGLSNKYRSILSSFNVGRNGCHLTVHERQAIALARALLADPDVLLLHKPLDNVEAGRRGEVWRLLQQFVASQGLDGLLGELRGKRRVVGGRRARTVVLTMSDAHSREHRADSVLDLSASSSRRQKRRLSTDDARITQLAPSETPSPEPSSPEPQPEPDSPLRGSRRVVAPARKSRRSLGLGSSGGLSFVQRLTPSSFRKPSADGGSSPGASWSSKSFLSLFSSSFFFRSSSVPSAAPSDADPISVHSASTRLPRLAGSAIRRSSSEDPSSLPPSELLSAHFARSREALLSSAHQQSSQELLPTDDALVGYACTMEYSPANSASRNAPSPSLPSVRPSPAIHSATPPNPADPPSLPNPLSPPLLALTSPHMSVPALSQSRRKLVGPPPATPLFSPPGSASSDSHALNQLRWRPSLLPSPLATLHDRSVSPQTLEPSSPALAPAPPPAIPALGSAEEDPDAAADTAALLGSLETHGQNAVVTAAPATGTGDAELPVQVAARAGTEGPGAGISQRRGRKLPALQPEAWGGGLKEERRAGSGGRGGGIGGGREAAEGRLAGMGLWEEGALASSERGERGEARVPSAMPDSEGLELALSRLMAHGSRRQRRGSGRVEREVPDEEAEEAEEEDEDEDEDEDDDKSFTLFREPEGYVPSFEPAGGVQFRGFRRVSDVRTVLSLAAAAAPATPAASVTPKAPAAHPHPSSATDAISSLFHPFRARSLRKARSLNHAPTRRRRSSWMQAPWVSLSNLSRPWRSPATTPSDSFSGPHRPPRPSPSAPRSGGLLSESFRLPSPARNSFSGPSLRRARSFDPSAPPPSCSRTPVPTFHPHLSPSSVPGPLHLPPLTDPRLSPQLHTLLPQPLPGQTPPHPPPAPSPAGLTRSASRSWFPFTWWRGHKGDAPLRGDPQQNRRRSRLPSDQQPPPRRSVTATRARTSSRHSSQFSHEPSGEFSSAAGGRRASIDRRPDAPQRFGGIQSLDDNPIAGQASASLVVSGPRHSKAIAAAAREEVSLSTGPGVVVLHEEWDEAGVHLV